MYYYRYNADYEIIEKSEIPMNGDFIVTSDEDLDIILFRVIVGYISEKGEILRYTKKVRDVNILINRLTDLEQKYSELLELVGTQN